MKQLAMAVICVLTIAGVAWAAQEVPALQSAKDPAERARVQGLINAARAEKEFLWTGFMIEPEHG